MNFARRESIRCFFKEQWEQVKNHNILTTEKGFEGGQDYLKIIIFYFLGDKKTIESSQIVNYSKLQLCN